MSDEITNANVIRVRRAAAGRWEASIGPDAIGMGDHGPTPEWAVLALMARCRRLDWPWDDTWVPREDRS